MLAIDIFLELCLVIYTLLSFTYTSCLEKNLVYLKKYEIIMCTQANQTAIKYLITVLVYLQLRRTVYCIILNFYLPFLI